MVEVEITCPVCNNVSQSGNLKTKKCFYSLARDCWHCFLCGAKGRGNPNGQEEREEMAQPALTLVGSKAFEFTEELLKAYQELFLENGEAQAYVKKRFGGEDSLETARRFGLGYDPGRHLLVIPVRDDQGQLVGVKYRQIDETRSPRYLSEPGSQAGFYWLAPGLAPELSASLEPWLEPKGDSKDLLICEGEIDAMALKVMGFEGAIIATQTNTVNEATRAKLSSRAREASRLFVWPDQDEAGQRLVEVVRELSPEARVVSLEGSLKDASALLESQGKEVGGSVVRGALGAAKSKLDELSYNGLVRLAETFDHLKNPLNTKGWSTGIRLLDERLGGGLLPYTLTAVSAPGKTGKTTFLTQLVFNLITRNISVGFLSLEMDPVTHVIPSLLSIGSQRNVRRLNQEQLRAFFETVPEDFPYLNKVTFFNRYGTTPAEEISDWISGQYHQHGVTVFFLDHVGYSLADIKDPAEHSRLSKALRALTRSLPIHIIAIVQPKQLPLNQRTVTKHDLYGSVTWSQDLNQLITLEKSQAPNQLKVRLTDSHCPLARPSDEEILLTYDPDTCSLLG